MFGINKKTDENIIWKAQKGGQVKFLSCPIFECLFESSRGAGKTDALIMDFAKNVGRGWGEAWKGILFRETYPNLKDVIAKSQKWFRKIFPDAKYNQADRCWTFTGGEKLYFRHARTIDDYWSYHGHEYPWVAWEELTNWPTPDLYLMMMSVCRSSDVNVTVRSYRSTCNPWGCVPYGNVLTVDNGLVPIDKVNVGDLVWSCNEQGVMVEKHVTDTIAYEYNGVMVKEESRGRHMEFTEDHRFPLLNTDRTKHEVKYFNDLPNEAKIRRAPDEWKGEDVDFVYSGFDVYKRKTRFKKVKKLTLSQYARLFGWFVTEGSTSIEHDGAFLISQIKNPQVQMIKDLLDECGFHYRYDGKQFWISDKNWALHFNQFGYAKDKYIPKVLKNASKKILNELYDVMMLGDGCNSVYYTISTKLRDDVVEILIKMGFSTYISSKRGGFSNSLCYGINKNNNNSLTLYTGGKTVNRKVKKTNVEKQMVYCLTVEDTETFYLEQKGFVWLSGNCGHNWVKSRFIDAGPAGKIIREIMTVDQQKEAGLHNPTKERVLERCYVHGDRMENVKLMEADPDYELNLARNNNEASRKAWIKGDWDICSGGMFDDLWKKETHILKSFRVPNDWKIYRAFDWGMSKPFSVGWWAVSTGSLVKIDDKNIFFPKGTLIRVGEWYGWERGKANKGLRITNTMIGRGIREREKRIKSYHGQPKIYPGPADASIFGEESDKITIAQKISRAYFDNPNTNVCIFSPSNKKAGTRKMRWQIMRDMLEASVIKNKEYPQIYVFNNCQEGFIRTIIGIPRDDKDPDDIDTDAEDHAMDESAYMILFSSSSIQMRRYTQNR